MTDATTLERDLAAVDAALDGGAATHPDRGARELQELALALRADAPEPDPGFAGRLAARAERGFPREPDAVRRARRSAGPPLACWRALARGRGGLRSWSPAAGARRAGRSAFSHDAASGGGGASGPGGAAPSQVAARGRGFAPGQPERRIERSFSLELDVPVGRA